MISQKYLKDEWPLFAALAAGMIALGASLATVLLTLPVIEGIALFYR